MPDRAGVPTRSLHGPPPPFAPSDRRLVMSIDEKLGLPMGKATRDAFGKALAELGKTRTDIVVVDGDVNNSTRTEWFAKAFPERFFNVGIAESNLVGVTAGLASAGHAA